MSQENQQPSATAEMIQHLFLVRKKLDEMIRGSQRLLWKPRMYDVIEFTGATSCTVQPGERKSLSIYRKVGVYQDAAKWVPTTTEKAWFKDGVEKPFFVEHITIPDHVAAHFEIESMFICNIMQWNPTNIKLDATVFAESAKPIEINQYVSFANGSVMLVVHNKSDKPQNFSMKVHGREPNDWLDMIHDGEQFIRFTHPSRDDG